MSLPTPLTQNIPIIARDLLDTGNPYMPYGMDAEHLSLDDAAYIILLELSLAEMAKLIPASRITCPPTEFAVPAILHMKFSALWINTYLSAEGPKIEINKIINEIGVRSFSGYTVSERARVMEGAAFLFTMIWEGRESHPVVKQFFELHMDCIQGYLRNIHKYILPKLQSLYLFYRDFSTKNL